MSRQTKPKAKDATEANLNATYALIQKDITSPDTFISVGINKDNKAQLRSKHLITSAANLWKKELETNPYVYIPCLRICGLSDDVSRLLVTLNVRHEDGSRPNLINNCSIRSDNYNSSEGIMVYDIKFTPDSIVLYGGGSYDASNVYNRELQAAIVRKNKQMDIRNSKVKEVEELFKYLVDSFYARKKISAESTIRTTSHATTRKSVGGGKTSIDVNAKLANAFSASKYINITNTNENGSGTNTSDKEPPSSACTLSDDGPWSHAFFVRKRDGDATKRLEGVMNFLNLYYGDQHSAERTAVVNRANDYVNDTNHKPRARSSTTATTSRQTIIFDMGSEEKERSHAKSSTARYSSEPSRPAIKPIEKAAPPTIKGTISLPSKAADKPAPTSGPTFGGARFGLFGRTSKAAEKPAENDKPAEKKTGPLFDAKPNMDLISAMRNIKAMNNSAASKPNSPDKISPGSPSSKPNSPDRVSPGSSAAAAAAAAAASSSPGRSPSPRRSAPVVDALGDASGFDPDEL
jgi:hypothetical protein